MATSCYYLFCSIGSRPLYSPRHTRGFPQTSPHTQPIISASEIFSTLAEYRINTGSSGRYSTMCTPGPSECAPSESACHRGLVLRRDGPGVPQLWSTWTQIDTAQTVWLDVVSFEPTSVRYLSSQGKGLASRGRYINFQGPQPRTIPSRLHDRWFPPCALAQRTSFTSSNSRPSILLW